MTLHSVENLTDEDGNPAGGSVYGTGFHIEWQNGPLTVPAEGVKPEDCSDPSYHKTFRYCPNCTWTDNGPMQHRQEPNGAFVEDVLTVCLRRLEHYNGTKFKCRENSLAITHIEEAIHWLNHRTAQREARGVEGTLTV